MTDKRPTERFTSRVDAYVRYRPGYPASLMALLQEQTGLTKAWSIADVGSGPGNLTRLLLDSGFAVVGVEPNDAMRMAGEALMADYANFKSVKGAAEATSLPDNTIDLITAGQAFHWFDPDLTRNEFERILRAPGWVALIWNKRPEGAAPLLDAWSAMLHELSPDYDIVRHRDSNAEEGMSILFAQNGFRRFTLQHRQMLDAESFWGRLISSSYTPLPGQPGHEQIKARSQQIFDEHAVDGIVQFPYETQVFIGQLRPG